MRILIATFLAPTSPSGVVTYCRTLADDLVGEGVAVEVVDASTTPRWWCRVLGVLSRVLRPFGGAVRVAYDEFAFYSSTYVAARRLRQRGIQVIHAQDVRSGVAAYRALGRKVPVVLTCHFNDDPVTEQVAAYGLGPRATRYLTRWYGYLFSFVRNYVFVSNYAFEKSRHLLPAGIEKRILHNTVRLEADLSRAARAASDPLLISNVGYIDERKNQQLLLEIGHELRRRNLANFAIWLIGDGPKRAEYEALAERLGLSQQVKFLGRQPAPWRLVAQTDLYVHTALNDNCPYSIVEAFAVKTPVLALPVGGVPELLPADSGPLHGTDVGTLTDQVAAYFDPARREGLARSQAAFAETHFNHRRALRELITFYHQAAQPV